MIGGGATGAGVLADLALRGFKCALVEKRDLAHGTTGRYHGLLHSGGRYVVKDPKAATECIEENRILRRIMPHCLEDTGGFFVVTPWDDDDFGETFMQGCHDTGVPCEEIPIRQMLKEERRVIAVLGMGGVGNGGTNRNLLDFFDVTVDPEGRVLVSYEDGCVGACPFGGASTFNDLAVIARQSYGKRLFAEFDQQGLAAPGPSKNRT